MIFARRIGRGEDFADAFQTVVTYYNRLRRTDPQRFVVEFRAFIAEGKQRGGASAAFAEALELAAQGLLEPGAK